MSCMCQECNWCFRLDLNIPDELWELIKPSKGLLCGSCIMIKLQKIFEYSAFELKEIKGN